jgi:hypothetical protein
MPLVLQLYLGSNYSGRQARLSEILDFLQSEYPYSCS